MRKRQSLALAIASLVAAPLFPGDVYAAKPVRYTQEQGAVATPQAGPAIAKPTAPIQPQNKPSAANGTDGTPEATGDDFLGPDSAPPTVHRRGMMPPRF